MHLLAFGINHHTAPVDIREKAAFATDKRVRRVAQRFIDEASQRGDQPVLIFEIGKGSSPFGITYDLATLKSIDDLRDWGVAVSAVVGINLFALGATSNYLVSLFYQRPIRQGLFGKPILKNPIESYFGMAGGIEGCLPVIAG